MRKECNKCGGTGELFMFKNIKNGVCFSCKGTGIKHNVKRTTILTTKYKITDGFDSTNTAIKATHQEALELAVEFDNMNENMNCPKSTVEEFQSKQYKTTKVAA